MAQVDASIPLSAIGAPQMTTAQALTLADMIEQRKERQEERPYRMEALRAQSQQNALSLQQMQLNVKKAQGVLKISQTPGMRDEEGVPTAAGVKAGMEIDPLEIGPAWAKLRTDAAKARTEQILKDLEIKEKRGEIGPNARKNFEENYIGLSKLFLDRLKKATDAGDPNPEFTATVAVQEEAERRKKSSLLNEDQYKAVLNMKWDKSAAEGVIAYQTPTRTPSETEDIISRQKGLDPKSTEWKQLEERRKYLAEHPSPITLMQTPEGKGFAVEPHHGGKPTVTSFDLPAPGAQKLGVATQGQYTPEAIDALADVWRKTGKMEGIPWGDKVTRAKVIQRAVEMNDAAGINSGDIPAIRSEYKAASTSLTAVSKDLNTFEPYKKMLDTNADIAIQLGQKIQQTAPVLVNKPLNWLRQNATTNPDVAEYLAQMRFVQTEAARVINNPRIVGQLTDESRREMDEVITGNAPLAVVQRVLTRLKTDGSSRFNAMRSQQQELGATLRNIGEKVPDLRDDKEPAAVQTKPVQSLKWEDLK